MGESKRRQDTYNPRKHEKRETGDVSRPSRGSCCTCIGYYAFHRGTGATNVVKLTKKHNAPICSEATKVSGCSERWSAIPRRGNNEPERRGWQLGLKGLAVRATVWQQDLHTGKVKVQ